MIYEELGAYDYLGGANGLTLLSVGWIDVSACYPKGDTPAEFLPKLKTMVHSRRGWANQTRGFHSCRGCPHYEWLILTGNGQIITADLPLPSEKSLGSAEVWMPHPTDPQVVYAAPDLICHYVEAHQYRPPQAYIDAVVAFDFASDWRAITVAESSGMRQ